MPPKFSIAIPAYNRSEYLRVAIASCIAQTADDFEIVVSDDCSTEDLREVAESFRDSRVKYCRSEGRLGAAKNHQYAVSRSIGSYVINLHSDDVLLPNCLEVAGKALDDYEPASAVYFSFTYLTDSRIHGFHSLPNVPFADNRTLRDNPWLEKFYGVIPSCCLFRKDAFDLIGGYRTSLRLAYDWDLYMRFMTLGGGVVFLPQILSIYRVHEEQSIRTRSLDGLWDVLDLWSLREYSHWPAWEISALALSQCSAAIRKGGKLGNIYRVFEQVGRRRLGWRVLSGLPTAVRQKLSARRAITNVEESPNYQGPANIESQLQRAKAFLQLLNF